MKWKIKRLDPEERMWAVWLGCCGFPVGLAANLLIIGKSPDNMLLIWPVVCLISWICAGYIVFLIKERRTSRTRFDHWTVILIWTPFTMFALVILPFFIGVLLMLAVGLFASIFLTK